MSTKRKYSDADRATALAALAANGGNVSHTARQSGVPASTLSEWAKCNVADGVDTNIREQKKGELADHLKELAHNLVGGIAARVEGGRLDPQTSLKDAATTLGIVIDKMQLLKGAPTQITQTLTEEDRRRMRAELKAHLQRADGESLTSDLEQ